MLVVKRDGRRESVKFDKILARIEKLCNELDRNYIDPVDVSKKVIEGLYEGVTTTELDNLAAETAATMTTKHPDYAVLAARIAISNLHKETNKSFSNTMKRLYTYIDPKTGENASLIATDVYGVIKNNAARLDDAVVHERELLIRLLWVQDTGALLLDEIRWAYRRETTAYAYESGGWLFIRKISMQLLKPIIFFLKSGLLTLHQHYSMRVRLNHNYLHASCLP